MDKQRRFKIDLHLMQEGSELLAKDIIKFYYHLKCTVFRLKPSCSNIISFWFNYENLPQFSSKSSAVDSFNLLQCWKLFNFSDSNFSTCAENLFSESLLNSSNLIFPSGTTSTRNYWIVAYAPEKNFCLFFLIQIIVLFLELGLQSSRQILAQKPF